MSSLNILKSYLDINPGDLTRDNELQTYLDRASDLHDSYLGRKFKMTVYTAEMHKNFERNIHLKNFPIYGVTKIVIDGNEQDLLNFRVWKNLGIIEMIDEYRPVLISGYYMEVDYTAGYDPLPGDLQEAEAITAFNLVNLKGVSGATGAIKKENIVDSKYGDF